MTREIRSAAVLVTRACQLDCVYCQFGRSVPPASDELLRRCAELVLSAPGAEGTLVFLGGEPLLRLDRVLATVDWAEARRAEAYPGKTLEYALTTNGLLVDDRVLDALAARRVRVHLSLDGSLQEAQRPTKAAGPYPRAALEKAFALLVARRHPFAVHMVVSPEGTGRMRADALAYLERGAPQVHFQYRVGALWEPEAARAYVREAAAFAFEARARGFDLDPREVMDSNEPSIVSRSVTVDVDGRAYFGCTVPAMENILPRLKECNFLGDAREKTLAELVAAGGDAEARAARLYDDDPVLGKIVASNLDMGRLCLGAERELLRRLSAGASA